MTSAHRRFLSSSRHLHRAHSDHATAKVADHIVHVHAIDLGGRWRNVRQYVLLVEEREGSGLREVGAAAEAAWVSYGERFEGFCRAVLPGGLMHPTVQGSCTTSL